MPDTPTKLNPCPTCGAMVDLSMIGQPGSFAPFCSERCKLVDLGRWLDGRYQIPVREEDESEDEGTPGFDEPIDRSS